MRGPGDPSAGGWVPQIRPRLTPWPGSSPAPKCAFDWEKEGRQDFQQQLFFQAVNGLDVLVPRGPGMEAQLNQLTNL